MASSHKAPVTEVAVLYLKEDAQIDATLERAAHVLHQQPGFLKTRYSRQVEYPDRLSIFNDWESYGDHMAFTKNAAVYEPFVADLGLIVDDSGKSPASEKHHVPFEPFPPTVLDNEPGAIAPVIEVLHLYFSVDGEDGDVDLELKQEVLVRAQQFIDILKEEAEGFTGKSAHGWVQETLPYNEKPSRALSAIVGWKSLEAHQAYRQTESFAKNIPLLRNLRGLVGMKVFHVVTKTIL